MVDGPRVEIEQDGPYRVRGVPVVRTAQVETAYGEPVDWAPDEPIPHGRQVVLCRCGGSSTKPFCDDSHETNGFDGTEVADRRPYDARREIFEGEGLVLEDDVSLCTDAGYCGDRFEHVWTMLDRAGDPAIRERIRTMTRLCPSGRIVTTLPGEERDEPPYEPSVAVITDGPIWVRGGVPVVAADGTVYEVRNRQTLCRCGHSMNKPFCDGSHKRVGFRDG